MTTDKNLLVVTWTAFPPTSGSGIILSNLLTQFDSNKTVLAGEHTFGAKLTEYEKPPYPFYLLKHSFHTGVRGSNHLKLLALGTVKKQLKEIITKHNIEVVLGVFPDELYTYAACEVAKELNIPFYSWFHNTYLDNRTRWLKFIAKRIQPKIFNYSSRIFTMSLGMNDFYQREYPHYADKMKPLLHGFHMEEKDVDINVELKKPYKFLLSGNINHSNRDATERLAKAVLEHDSNNQLHVFGGNKKEEWDSMGISGSQVYLHGFIPLKQLVAQFDQYDIMLLPHGFDGDLSPAEYETIFPTRTIPLLHSGKPILAHSPKGTAITRMLVDTKSACLVTERDSAELQKAIIRIIEDQKLREKLVTGALKAAKKYNVKRTAAELKEIIFSV